MPMCGLPAVSGRYGWPRTSCSAGEGASQPVVIRKKSRTVTQEREEAVWQLTRWCVGSIAVQLHEVIPSEVWCFPWLLRRPYWLDSGCYGLSYVVVFPLFCVSWGVRFYGAGIFHPAFLPVSWDSPTGWLSSIRTGAGHRHVHAGRLSHRQETAFQDKAYQGDRICFFGGAGGHSARSGTCVA